jgi:hypothetical protein
MRRTGCGACAAGSSRARPHGIRCGVDSRTESHDNVEMKFASLQWLFPALVLLHNLEEALWLPGWANRTGFWRTPVSPRTFRFVVTVLTALSLAVTWLSARSGAQTFWTYLMFGFVVATLANSVFPHLALSISRRSYMPGTATAVALNLPVLSFLVASALSERQVSGWKSAAYAGGVSALLLLFVAVLFKPGRWFVKVRSADRQPPAV